jgi:hypothetical protein
MELLLNLAWLLLALPAYWLWRHSSTIPAHRRFTSLQCLLALGCMLVILFPVVSATDDLHAMRAEMEDSSATKRSIGQRASEKSSTCKVQGQPLFAVALCSFVVNSCHWHLAPVVFFPLPTAPAIERTGRSPPFVLA